MADRLARDHARELHAMRTPLNKSRRPTCLPDFLFPAHELCFLHHDVLVELLRAGGESGTFQHELPFSDDSDRIAFDAAEDVFQWLETSGRARDRADLLRLIVFPALLSDFLHFVYEALESSRTAKLAVCYALIRKPIQENLFLLETIAIDAHHFSQQLSTSPQRLRAQKAGGLDVHERRIADTLAVLEDERFDARYLTRLRYDRAANDGFDGLCNRAIHLFTDHEAIRTEPLNVNFIFSGDGERLAQWYQLYSRLPYLLDYARQVVEHVCAQFSVTAPTYRADMERRMMAATLLWAPGIATEFRHDVIERYVAATRRRLVWECSRAGFASPSTRDLVRMKTIGAFPGESTMSAHRRNVRNAALELRRRMGEALGSYVGRLARR